MDSNYKSSLSQANNSFLSRQNTSEEQINKATAALRQFFDECIIEPFKYTSDFKARADEILNSLANFIHHGADISTITPIGFNFLSLLLQGVVDDVLSSTEFIQKNMPEKADVEPICYQLSAFLNFMTEFSTLDDEISYQLSMLNYPVLLCRILNWAYITGSGTSEFLYVDTNSSISTFQIIFNFLHEKQKTSKLFSFSDIYTIAFRYHSLGVFYTGKPTFLYTVPEMPEDFQKAKLITSAFEVIMALLVWRPDGLNQFKCGENYSDPIQRISVAFFYFISPFESNMRCDQNIEIWKYQISIMVESLRYLFKTAIPQVSNRFCLSDHLSEMISYLSFGGVVTRNILECLSYISSNTFAHAYMIITEPTFAEFQPLPSSHEHDTQKSDQQDDFSVINKEIIIFYCKIWEGAFNALTDFPVKNQGRMKSALSAVLAKYQQIVKTIIRVFDISEDYVVQKAALMVLVSLIKLQNDNIIKYIFEYIPDLTKRILSVLEDHDPKDSNNIFKALIAIITFINKNGASEYSHFVADIISEDMKRIVEEISMECDHVDYQYVQQTVNLFKELFIQLASSMQ
ncbi:hypothetical protein TRFO_31317 [Tritrichomonas foetus]|uniref:Uncharacterized protein n=1 Tax=Tritrichomonas foetus TaxID=1144522 RepID=A0A1J4JRK8_9EUKA|nr:hypothetical protein TRFO_31317 [Tritrichomonas foetus]|eukprot:OHT01753.1 hypothetical protein TRFO_31317 [Tritrichomonas foetus]